MSTHLPKHTIERLGNTSVWLLFDANGKKIAAYTEGHGVFALRTGNGWTRETANAAFRKQMEAEK